MENKPVSTFKTALNYGLITGVLLIVFSLIIFLLDVDFEMQRYFSYISYLIVAVMIVLVINAYKKASGGFITYGKAFTLSFILILIAFIIGTIYSYFYFTMIDPGMAEEISSQAAIQAQENVTRYNPDASQQDIDNAVSMAEKFSTPTMIMVWGFIMNMIWGTILSLIIPIFMKKKNPAEI